MQIIRNTTEFHLDAKTAVAIGKFDGIHRGHRKLIEEILGAAKDGRRSAVITFDPSPSSLFGKGEAGELTTREEKRIAFEKLGIDFLIEFPLNAQTAAMAPERFVSEILSSQMRAGFIAAGTDLSFGDRGAGDCALLKRLAPVFGYQVKIIDKVCRNGREVSSTFVREEVAAGHMEAATELLGGPYSVSGTVVHGKQLGRKIGMPTVNLLPPQSKLLPPNGVYYSTVFCRGKSFRGITNIGCKPTVSETSVMGVETYIYDFHEDLYGDRISVGLLSFKRPERRFSSVEELKKQMERDIEEGRFVQHVLERNSKS